MKSEWQGQINVITALMMLTKKIYVSKIYFNLKTLSFVVDFQDVFPNSTIFGYGRYNRNNKTLKIDLLKFKSNRLKCKKSNSYSNRLKSNTEKSIIFLLLLKFLLIHSLNICLMSSGCIGFPCLNFDIKLWHIVSVNELWNYGAVLMAFL